jgi:hypothetical protein
MRFSSMYSRLRRGVNVPTRRPGPRTPARAVVVSGCASSRRAAASRVLMAPRRERSSAGGRCIGAACLLALLALAPEQGGSTAAPSTPDSRAGVLVPGNPALSWRCDATLARRFTPARPRLGRYEVCTAPAPIRTAAPAEWPIEQQHPLDAFGKAGVYDRAALARLYGGILADVARGWRRREDWLESFTMISPYPDSALARLERGTLVIVHTLPAGGIEASPASEGDRPPRNRGL